MGKKRLPPPPSPDDPVILALKQAHSRPRRLSKKAAEEFLRRRQQSMIQQLPGARVLMRRGKTVWRKSHGPGADLDRPPISVTHNRLEQRHESESNIAARTGRWRLTQREASVNGVEVRRRKSVSQAAVIAYAEKHAHLGCHLARTVAREFHITPTRVRQILLLLRRKRK